MTMADNTIYDHEMDKTTVICNTFTEFLNMLYA